MGTALAFRKKQSASYPAEVWVLYIPSRSCVRVVIGDSEILSNKIEPPYWREQIAEWLERRGFMALASEWEEVDGNLRLPIFEWSRAHGRQIGSIPTVSARRDRTLKRTLKRKQYSWEKECNR